MLKLALSLLVSLTALIALTAPTIATTTPVTPPPLPIQDLSCVSRCDTAKNTCWRTSTEYYRNCGSTQACRTRSNEIYNECMAERNCKQCFDGRTGAVWYCSCGRPTSSGGVRGGENIEAYDYSEVPWDYTWEGWGCETNPEWCDPDLWWM